MQKANILYSIVTAIVIGTACSGNDDALKIGDVFDNSTSMIFYTDTLTVNAYTVTIDSFVSSGYNKVFIGNKTDTYLGEISAKAYVPFGFSSNDPSFDDGATFDSLVLVLTPNGEYLGDTNLIRNFSVVEVVEEITPFDDGYFYNNTQFSVNEKAIASVNLELRPLRSKPVYVHFPDSLGQVWFNSILADDENFVSTTSFQKYFKGLCLIPNETEDNWSATFYGLIDDSDDDSESSNGIELRLYYSKPFQEDNFYYAFIPHNSDYIYSCFNSNRSGTALAEKFLETTQVNSSETNNLIFMQSGSGLGIKIDIPAIDRINEIASNISILNAELIMKPHPNTYDKNNPLPSSLNIFWTTKSNSVGNALYDITGESVITATLHTDKEFNDNSYYSASIINYVLAEINEEGYSKNNLLFLVSAETFSTTFDRVVIMDNEMDKYSMQLKLYYAIY